MGLANLWHACPKWHAEIFPLSAACTAVLNPFLFLLPYKLPYIVKNVCVHT